MGGGGCPPTGQKYTFVQPVRAADFANLHKKIELPAPCVTNISRSICIRMYTYGSEFVSHAPMYMYGLGFVSNIHMCTYGSGLLVTYILCRVGLVFTFDAAYDPPCLRRGLRGIVTQTHVHK